MVSSTQAPRRKAGGGIGVFGSALSWLYPHPGFWLALCGLCALNMGWVLLDPRLGLAPPTLLKMGTVFGGTALALAYRQWRGPGQGRVFDALFCLLLLALFTGFLTQQVNLFSHLAMTLGRPWADRQLAAWDRAIGFDWNGYVRTVAAHPWGRLGLQAAYSLSIGPALAAILIISVWRGRHDRVDELAFLALASGLVCVGVAGLLPAVSAWNSLAEPDVRALVGPLPQAWLEQVRALRGEGPVSLDLSSMEGIATFPSFHTCLALIIAWCSRGHWAGVLAGSALGLAVLAATPVYGEHYGVDLLGGTAVIAGLALLWRKLAPDPRPGGGRA